MRELSYFFRKIIRNWPGVIIKAVPRPHPVILTGQGSRAETGEICRKEGYSRVLLVTDRTLFALGFHKAVEESLKAAGIRYTIFSDIDSEPTKALVSKIRNVAIQIDADCVVALGGGSVMDSCKLVAVGLKLRRLPLSLMTLRFLIVPGQSAPLVTIPTTAGTGAETTFASMLCNPGKRSGKSATVIVGLNIAYTIQDSELTMNAPRSVTASCGIDALSHNLEGCVSRVRADAETVHASKEGVRLVLENLPVLLEESGDRTKEEITAARQAMCLAAYYGGNAINCQLAGYVHAFAHSIGAMYHLPHGYCIAVSLLPVMRAERAGCESALAHLARYCSLPGSGADDVAIKRDVDQASLRDARLTLGPDADKASDKAAADSMMHALENLIHLCGYDKATKAIPPEDIHTLTRLIEQDSINYCAPVVMKASEICQILKTIRI